MELFIILNRTPYDGTDVTWNALRLAGQALNSGMAVRIFLMNDSVDLARAGLQKGDEFDLQKMLLDLIAKGAESRLCKTCITRCGIGGGDMIPEVEIATMPDLVEWIGSSQKVVSF